MTTIKAKGKGTRATSAGQLIAGIRKRFLQAPDSPAPAFVTADAAVGELQQLLGNRAATTAAQATARDKVQAEGEAMPALVAFMNAIEAFIRLTFSNDTAALADFGLQPRKRPAPQTAEQKAVAAAKRKATREARGTTSAKAKQAIKGNITAQLVVTPATRAQACGSRGTRHGPRAGRRGLLRCRGRSASSRAERWLLEGQGQRRHRAVRADVVSSGCDIRPLTRAPPRVRAVRAWSTFRRRRDRFGEDDWDRSTTKITRAAGESRRRMSARRSRICSSATTSSGRGSEWRCAARYWSRARTRR